jgi:phage shock protein A
MRWWERLQLLVRTTLHDLVAEDSYTPPDRTQTVLADGQARLIALRQELDGVLAREKRAQLAYQKAQALVVARQKQVDEKLAGGDRDAAATELSALLEAQQQADQSHQRYQEHAQASQQLRQIIQTLQTQLERIRHQDGSLAEQEQDILALERLHQLRQEQKQSVSTIHLEQTDEAESLARRRDRLSAHQDLEERRLREDWE